MGKLRMNTISLGCSSGGAAEDGFFLYAQNFQRRHLSYSMLQLKNDRRIPFFSYPGLWIEKVFGDYSSQPTLNNSMNDI